MNKTISFAVLAISFSLILTIAGGKKANSDQASTYLNEAKTNWNAMLAKTSTPPSVGNMLTDGSGGKSDCHLMGITSNKERRNVTNWTCWGEKGHSFPNVSTRWAIVKPELSMIIASTYPTPNSVGNILTNSIGRKHDCHLTNHLKNNEGGSVSEWTCWSIKRF